MLKRFLQVPKRLWLLPMICLSLTLVSIAQGQERRGPNRAPAVYAQPVYASPDLSDPVASSPSWARGRSLSAPAVHADKFRLPLVAFSIDATGRQLERGPDSFNRAYFRR